MKIDHGIDDDIKGVMHIGGESYAFDVAPQSGAINSSEGMQKVDTPLETAREDM